jgi:hypothetical protein
MIPKIGAAGELPAGIHYPVFLDFSDHRRAMKEKYGVDFFVADWIEASSGKTFLDFFQQNRCFEPKGILAVELR